MLIGLSLKLLEEIFFKIIPIIKYINFNPQIFSLYKEKTLFSFSLDEDIFIKSHTIND